MHRPGTGGEHTGLGMAKEFCAFEKTDNEKISAIKNILKGLVKKI